MEVYFEIGKSVVTLVYDMEKTSDTFEVWGEYVVEQGWVTELSHVLYGGRSVTLNDEWTNKAKRLIENLGE